MKARDVQYHYLGRTEDGLKADVGIAISLGTPPSHPEDICVFSRGLVAMGFPEILVMAGPRYDEKTYTPTESLIIARRAAGLIQNRAAKFVHQDLNVGDYLYDCSGRIYAVKHFIPADNPCFKTDLVRELTAHYNGTRYGLFVIEPQMWQH